MSDLPKNETANLRAALEAANRSAATATARANDAETRLRSEQGARVSAQESAIDNALAQARAEASGLETRWADLQAEGDFAEAAKLMTKSGEAVARIGRLEAQKEWLNGQKVAAEQQPQDPLANFSAQERDWINRNPRYMQDTSFQQKANAAAMHAEHVLGIQRNTPEWFSAIERTVYPERATEQGGGEAAGEGETTPFSDTGDDGHVPTDTGLYQQHTMDAPAISITPEPPAMRLDEKPAQQPRAVGRGGAGIRALAAPPSRNIAAAVRRVSPMTQRIEPTPIELATAHALYDAIEPNADDRTDETVARWYYALAHHPSHRTTRRRNWAQQSVIGA